MEWMPPAAMGLALRTVLWAAGALPFVVAWIRRQGGDSAITAGVPAMATLGVFLAIVAWDSRREAIPPARFALGTVALAMFALTHGSLPLAIGGLFPGLAALWYFSSQRHAFSFSMPLLGLLLLGLPSARMLDVVAGYPLRVVATRLAAFCLSGIGAPVTRLGMELSWDGMPVWVDAPCSGIKMLLAGLWLVCALAQLHRFGFVRTFLAGVFGVLAIILANAARIAILTAAEGFGMSLSPATHSAIGVSALLGGAVLCVSFTSLLSRWKTGTHPDFQTGTDPVFTSRPTQNSDVGATGTDHVFCCKKAGTHPVFSRFGMGTDPVFWNGRRKFILMHLIGISVVMFAMAIGRFGGLGEKAEASGDGDASFPGWPRECDGMPLEETPLTIREAGFATGFPGKVARFNSDGRIIILRWVTKPSHAVHSGEDCLLATGWSVETRPLARRADGDWSCFVAERDGKRLHVREHCIEANGGKTWSDVAAWYWAALLCKTEGPWWIITIAEP